MFLCIPWVELKIWLIQRVLEYTSLVSRRMSSFLLVCPLFISTTVWTSLCMCVYCLYFLFCWCCFCSLTSCVRAFPWRREQKTLLWLSVLSFNKLAPWSLTSFTVVCLTFTVVVREVFSFPVISSRADFLHFALDCCECHRFTFLKCWSVSYNNTLIGDRTSCCLSCSSFVFPAWDLSSLSAAALFQKQPHLFYVDALIYPRFVLWLEEVSIYGACSLGTQYLKC